MRQNAKKCLGAWALLVGAVICEKLPHDLALGVSRAPLCRQTGKDRRSAGGRCNTPVQVAR